MPLLDLLNKTDTQQEAPLQREGHFNEIMTTFEQGATEGQRNIALTRLGGLLRSHGLSQHIISGVLLCVNDSRKIELTEKEVRQIAYSVSRYTPALENRMPHSTDILTVKQAGENWKKQQETSTTCCSGFTRLDNEISLFSPGEVFIVAGRSGTLKTTSGIQIARGYAETLHTNCLFASLEMNSESVFFRMANSELSMSSGIPCTAQNTVAAIWETEELFHKTIQKNACFRIVDKDSLTLEQIEHYLTLTRETETVDLILIDYLGYVRDAQSGSNYEKVSRIARGVKALAKRTKSRIILLCQTSRAGEDGTTPVQLHHLRDSGAIEESGDYIIGIWHSRTEDNRLHCEILKNRSGERGIKIDIINSGLNLIETEYKPEPRMKYE